MRPNPFAAHKERAHSKYSASGAERWFNCPGSIALNEGLPDKSSPWAEEGTKAHEVLEQIMLAELSGKTYQQRAADFSPALMEQLGQQAADFILSLGRKLDAEVLVETKVYLSFIHPEMFGTYDGAVLDHFGTLHVFDYKYGAGHPVSPIENLQMIFYGIGVAHEHHWNFKKIRHWIIQPRIKGYDGPVFWEESAKVIKDVWVPKFERAVEQVEAHPNKYAEGGHCHWCRAKSICPLKREEKNEKAKNIFGRT